MSVTSRNMSKSKAPIPPLRHPRPQKHLTLIEKSCGQRKRSLKTEPCLIHASCITFRIVYTSLNWLRNLEGMIFAKMPSLQASHGCTAQFIHTLSQAPEILFMKNYTHYIPINQSVLQLYRWAWRTKIHIIRQDLLRVLPDQKGFARLSLAISSTAAPLASTFIIHAGDIACPRTRVGRVMLRGVGWWV